MKQENKCRSEIVVLLNKNEEDEKDEGEDEEAASRIDEDEEFLWVLGFFLKKQMKNKTDVVL